MDEIWKPVPYEAYSAKYEISNFGRVRPTMISRYSNNKAKYLKPVSSPRGYLFISLYANGKQYSAFIHRMVALAFHGQPPDDKPYACHKDDCQTNNRADNLYWGSHADNTKDREERGKTSIGTGNGRAIITENDVRTIRQLYSTGHYSQQKLGKTYCLNQSQISRIILRKAWAHIT